MTVAEGQYIMRSVSEAVQALDVDTDPLALQGVCPACSNAFVS